MAGVQIIAGRILFALAVVLLAAVAAGLLWATYGGAFVAPEPAAASPVAVPAAPGPLVPARRRPADQARPFHDAVRDAYKAGKLREEDVLGAIHVLYHEFGTEEARALAADLEQMIGAGGSK